MEPFLIWTTRYAAGQCVILVPQLLTDDFELTEGVSLAARWPADVVCPMDPQWPKDLQLADSLHGTRVRVISDRLRRALNEAGVGGVEFLPVAIINHKGRVAARDYWVVNPPATIDCIDLDASGVEWNSIDPELIDGCEQLVIRPETVPATTQVFRPRFDPGLILIRSEFAHHLQVQGFTGLKFRSPAQYTGLFV